MYRVVVRVKSKLLYLELRERREEKEEEEEEAVKRKGKEENREGKEEEREKPLSVSLGSTRRGESRATRHTRPSR